MKLLLTFVGTGIYQPCRYQLDGQTSNEEVFFSAALAQAIKPDLVLSLETVDATNKHGSTLSRRFTELQIAHQAVPIPVGSTEPQLWEIFAALTKHVPHDCALHLDITHGFRSLPLLGFLALSYLRVTRNITIGGIHYGAWEANNQSTNIAPAFDLSPFLTLLDWTAAADSFFTTGSAARLGGLLSGIQQDLWKEPGALAPSNLPRKLKSLGANIGMASADLIMLRTQNLCASTKSLNSSLEQARQEAGAHALPFLEVVDPVVEQLSRFGNSDPATLRELVGWLAERGHAAASLTLASEWLTDFVISVSSVNAGPSHEARKPAADCIAHLEGMVPLEKLDPASLAVLEIVKLRLSDETREMLPKISSTVRHARNDLNHAGYNACPASSSTLSTRAIEVAELLRKLPLP